VTAEASVIDRNRTGFPTVGQRNRELLAGGADMCISRSQSLRDLPQDARLRPTSLARRDTYLCIENVHAIPRRIKRDTKLR
jgi:hypothetical protein